MIEPTNKKLNEFYRQAVKRLADMNKQSFDDIKEVRFWLKDQIESLLGGDWDNRRKRIIEAYIVLKYKKMFDTLEQGIINNYNQSVKGHRQLAYSAGRILPPVEPITQIPKRYAETYKVFTEKSKTVRSKVMARRITRIIDESVEKGYAIEKTTKLLDIEFGYRDSNGDINPITLKRMKSGRLVKKNGHFYQTYRIARTESMRMNSVSGYEAFDELRAKGEPVRMKLKAHLDTRTRDQSENMNGQVSNENGEFLYPDGKYHRLGSSGIPPEYGINDRETCYIVFEEQ